RALHVALLDGRPGRSGRAGCGGDVLTELPRGPRFELALRDLVEEGLITDLQEAGGFRAVPLDALEHLRKSLPLGLLCPTASDVSQAFRAERTGARRGRLHLPAARDEVLKRLFAILHHYAAADPVFQLAHLAAPGILQKPGRLFRRELLVSPILLIELREEVRRQNGDLLFTVSQRGNADLHHVQAIVEIFA